MTISDKLRRDMDRVARRYMEGESLRAIGRSYECDYKLVERIMKQMLPTSYFIELARRRIERHKQKHRHLEPVGV